jgi:hypothetical protein
MAQVEQGWAGIDVGKTHHHVVLLDVEGRTLFSRRVANDETELRSVITTVLEKAAAVTWAIDLVDTPAALTIALLHKLAQPLVHISGIAVNRASDGYRGEARPTRRTQPLSPTRHGCGATCVRCASRRRTSSNCGC